MQTDEKTYDTRVRIAEIADLYVSDAARAQMQADAQDQVAEHLVRGQELFEADDFDVSDLDKCG